jgi:hypothetical protein
METAVKNRKKTSAREMRDGKQWIHTTWVVVGGNKVIHTAGNTNDCHSHHTCNHHHHDFCSANIGSEQCYHVRL